MTSLALNNWAQTFNFTYKLISNWKFLKNKADNKCCLKFGRERVQDKQYPEQ